MGWGWKERQKTAGGRTGTNEMLTLLFHKRALWRSMVPPIYWSGSDVPSVSLSTLVLRIWAAQPIGRRARDWQSCGVKRTALCGVGEGGATRVLSNQELAFRNALKGL
jgi:hypothetical protein